MTEIEAILTYWLTPEPRTEDEVEARNQFWFWTGGPDVDREIQTRFGALVEQARAGKLDGWTETPRGTLALIILIDQFSRNVFRGSAEAFACDAKAVDLARAGFDAGRFDQCGPLERLFAALPFRHAEEVEPQKRGVALAVTDALNAEPYLKKFLVFSVDFARKHLDVIVRFGRFPHRNATLGRLSTPEELEYIRYLKHAGQWL